MIERTFTQADFDVFAALSGDNNPIHVDPAFAANTRFERTVAHGMLLFSAVRGLLEQVAPNYRLTEQSLMFPAPAFADQALTCTAEIIETDGNCARVAVEVRTTDNQQVVLQGVSVLHRATE